MKKARYPIEVYFLLIPGLIIFFADVILNSILDFPLDAEIVSKIPPVLKTGGKGFGTGSVIILFSSRDVRNFFSDQERHT